MTTHRSPRGYWLRCDRHEGPGRCPALFPGAEHDLASEREAQQAAMDAGWQVLYIEGDYVVMCPQHRTDIGRRDKPVVNIDLPEPADPQD